MAKEIENNKKIKVVEFSKFDGLATKTLFHEIKENLFNCDRVDLIPKEKIIKLNIRWSELYCVCTEEEWIELYKILKEHGVKIKKRNIADLILDILNFFFVQPIELIIYFFKRKK
ncbi:MAG: hypothetical protein PHV48_04585 [Candidatus Omnitrophica bacterium]|nr:hypothetical protein [Candidatus Omnitrophota bacterium]